MGDFDRQQTPPFVFDVVIDLREMAVRAEVGSRVIDLLGLVSIGRIASVRKEVERIRQQENAERDSKPETSVAVHHRTSPKITVSAFCYTDRVSSLEPLPRRPVGRTDPLLVLDGVDSLDVLVR